MQIKDITHYLEQLAPLAYAEDFDNVGLLVGNAETEVTGIIITLDTLEQTVEQAIAENCNLIVSFHPIIFAGLKQLNGANYVERVVIKAIQNNIAIYATHTALDNSFHGVSGKMSEVLQLRNTKILLPKKQTIQKLQTYVPLESAASVRSALHLAGAGNIGNYSNCSFNVNGEGYFKGNQLSKPRVGKKNVVVKVAETLISVTFAKHLQQQIVTALHSAHPFEEVAYEIYTLENSNQKLGMGMIGNLPKPLNNTDFLAFVKQQFKAQIIKHSALLTKPIQKVAVLGGAGSFAISNAKVQQADAYIAADFKYHDFFRAEGKILLVDIGHYESEQFTLKLLLDYLKQKFHDNKIKIAKDCTNPVNYF